MWDVQGIYLYYYTRSQISTFISTGTVPVLATMCTCHLSNMIFLFVLLNIKHTCMYSYTGITRYKLTPICFNLSVSVLWGDFVQDSNRAARLLDRYVQEIKGWGQLKQRPPTTCPHRCVGRGTRHAH